jgi:hypothetical protein
MTSPIAAPIGIAIVAVVVVLEFSPPRLRVGTFRSCAVQVQPFGAWMVVIAPFIRIVTEQLFAPSVKMPALPVPEATVTLHPVKFGDVVPCRMGPSVESPGAK